MSTTGSTGEPGNEEAVRNERAAAFGLLTEIVKENQELGRRSYGASVKPELKHRTFGGFDESRLRFDSFRSFLRGAADAGAVDIHPAPRGPDVVLAPPGEPPIVDPPPDKQPRRIRKDLWDAFFDWDERKARAYDIERGEALRYPATPVPLEPPDLAGLRNDVAQQSERFRQINPIPLTAQVDWMREFVEELGSAPVRQQLEAALTEARPARAFSHALVGHPEARHQWTAYRLRRVEAEIQRWASTAGVEIDIFERVLSDDEEAQRSEAVSIAEAETEDERERRVREHLKRVVDRMPASELERLQIPFGYTLDF